MKKAIHFGAGAIGRGLVGCLLHDSGYQLIVVDTDQKIIDQINEENSYELIEMEFDFRRKVCDNVYAFNAITEQERIAKHIADAEILTTSVRVENLVKIAPLIGKGLLKRAQTDAHPIDILAFENAYKASDILKQHILDTTSDLSEETMETVACFANTITDRVVMNIEENGKSVIQVGDTFEAAVEQNKLHDPNARPIKDGVYTQNIDLLIDRKLFVVNGGHCSCGYLANAKGYEIMMDGFEDKAIYNQVRNEMREVGYMLSVKHSIPFEDLEKYIEFALDRYLNSKNTDYVKRVCRNPIRKLSASDRLVSPAVQAEQLGLPFENIATTIAAVFLFDAKEDQESQQIQAYKKEHGIEKAITKFTSFEEGTSLYNTVLEKYIQLTK